MAGEGFSKHASTSLRDNRSLLRKKSIFKKERTFLQQKSEDIKSDLGKTTQKKAPAYLLSRIRRKTLEDNKDESRIQWILAASFFLFLILLVTRIVNTMSQKEINFTNSIQLEQKEKNLEKYNYLISSGDEWLKQKQYYNAAFQYKLALDIFPLDSVASYRLITAYDLNCKNDNRNCGESEKIMAQLIGD